MSAIRSTSLVKRLVPEFYSSPQHNLYKALTNITSMAATFIGEIQKQLLITTFISRKSFHSRYNWVKKFPLSATATSVADFHAQVTSGPTVTVGILADGSVIGGYTSVSWSINLVKLHDPDAFLFSIPHNGAAQFFPATGNAQVSHKVDEGPCFGNKELYFSLAADHAGSQCLALVNFAIPAGGAVVNGPGVIADPLNPAAAWTPAAGPKKLLAVEVYQIIPAEYPTSRQVLEIAPLLLRLKTDFAGLRTKQGLKKLNICLVGDAKGGKSTTLNNLLSVLSADRELIAMAFSSNLEDHGTKSYAKYALGAIGDIVNGLDPIPVNIYDFVGFTNANIAKVETLISFIAQGRLPEGGKLQANPAYLPPTPPDYCLRDDAIHLFVMVIPADAITNPVKMEQYRRIERAIRTEPPTSFFPSYSSVVYLVTQMDDAERGGDTLLHTLPTSYDISQLWSEYKKILNSKQGLGNADAFPIVNICEQFAKIPDNHAAILLEAWKRILAAIRTNTSQWR